MSSPISTQEQLQHAETQAHFNLKSLKLATRGVKLLPSQTGTLTEAPVPYTGNPFLLCWVDTLLFFKEAWSIVGVLSPMRQWNGGDMDELYPSLANLICLGLHGFLIVFQLAFLLSLPFTILLPMWAMIGYVGAVMTVVFAIARVLNGGEDTSYSTVDLEDDADKHDDECWIYLNGVSVGKHWLKGNLNRLSLTFRRPIIGVHNQTYGIIFDLIQCLIERNFCYPTTDIRRSYVTIKSCLLSEQHKRVILILHSQGGIEGSLILDWLLSELPHDVLQKLEIYTFGCAANHFNNPHRSYTSLVAAQTPGSTPSANNKSVRHIEHYANNGDFVARWGVLAFTRMQYRYMGRVFVRAGTGHLLNQHYLNVMFPLDKNMRIEEKNGFMDQSVMFSDEGAESRARESMGETLMNGGRGTGDAIVVNENSPIEPAKLANKKPKVRAFSRLWEYRNGMSPNN
ncbi:hypothetical protein EJ04DRAFT_484800 [Polyplosphaeria fusca]|uniref:Uncharacterized protein n=1 Tax=Polyplosphaeria fusca TaxID=682080 RepID=A0A9P4V465_9PLEO|nr:hypothetical protein EJ04DRAFT_484800 [Polyplosphaeria fusca]